MQLVESKQMIDVCSVGFRGGGASRLPPPLGDG